jgi:DNA-binding MurR/RpiR family transcriptional regulator
MIQMKESSTAGNGLRPAIESLLPSLTPSAARIAKLLLDDPSAASHMTISQLGEAAGTSESTIVRTARALGFPGYSELRLALAASGAGEEDDERGTLSADIARGDALEVVVAKLAVAEENALRATVAQLDVAVLERVVKAVGRAQRVDIYGVGVSGLVARDLWQKLHRIGVMCHVHTELHQALTSAVLLGPRDLAIAVSHSGGTADVLEPLRKAKDNGATTVALTSRPRSALARMADHTLQSAGREEPLRPGAMASRTSQLLVADAVFIGVAQRRHDKAVEALSRTYETLRERRGGRA